MLNKFVCLGAVLLLELVGSAASSAELNFRFCSIDDDNVSYLDSQQVWGAAQVHRAVRAKAESVRSSLFSAYTASYIVMTKERDIARCSGELAADDPASELIGDRLADIMSRTYLQMVGICVKNPNFDENFSGFCQDLREIQRHDRDGLTAAMMTTATYLSSHMAQALVAVIYDDLFWDSFTDEATHTLARDPRGVLHARLGWVRSYKTLYDKNNEFLVHNFVTVAGALYDGCYLRTNALSALSSIAEVVPISPLLFGSVRDRTFATALQLAEAIVDQPSVHPMIIMVNGRYEVQFDNYRPWQNEPEGLIAVKNFARLKFTPPLSSVAFRAIGGVRQAEYQQLLITDSGCVLPQ